MTSPIAVAVLGTGIMGAPMARNLCAAGLGVRVWNRTPAKARPLGEAGAVVAGSPAEAAEGAGVLLTMLADADAVLDVAGQALAGGMTWLQMSTVGLEGTERCATLADERGAVLVDAPVLGTKQPAEQGKLIVFGSGPVEQRDRLAPVLDAVGARTIWLGEAGAGTRLKLVANNWVFAVVGGLAETLALAETLGVAPGSFLDAIAGGPLDSGYAQLKGKMMIARELDPAFPLRHAAKDARLIVEAAERHGLEAPLVDAVAARLADGVERGNGDLDIAATFLSSAAAA